MQRTFALQFHDLNNIESVEHQDGDIRSCTTWFTERASAMAPGFLSFWCWDPKEGWQHIATRFRVTTSGPVREAREPLPQPADLAVPGEESALEFAPEDFRLE